MVVTVLVVSTVLTVSTVSTVLTVSTIKQDRDRFESLHEHIVVLMVEWWMFHASCLMLDVRCLTCT